MTQQQGRQTATSGHFVQNLAGMGCNPVKRFSRFAARRNCEKYASVYTLALLAEKCNPPKCCKKAKVLFCILRFLYSDNPIYRSLDNREAFF